MTVSKKTKEFIKNPEKFLHEHNDKKNVPILIKIIKELDEAYYNSISIVSDKYYDLINEQLKELDFDNEQLKTIGADVSEKMKVKLPFILGSMQKPKLSDMKKFIDNFKTKFPGPYIISDKLDGISALYNTKTKTLTTRGNGYEGFDISNLLNIINMGIINNPDDKREVLIRGELVMSKNNFKKFDIDKKNARNLVSGVVNSKNINNREAKCIDFVPHEIVNPWYSFSKQFSFLNKMFGKQTVHNIKVDNINMEYLINLFRERIKQSKYIIDGLIISSNKQNERSVDMRPKYSFAFKNIDDLEQKKVKVIDINWQISKDGYYKPVVIIDPVKLDGVEIKRITGHNAKYIYDNNLGYGSEIIIVRSGGVIPFIKEIVKSSKKPLMPSKGTWVWNTTEVDIITVNSSVEQKIQELTLFCKRIGIEHMGVKNVIKLVNSGIDSIEKILKITKKDLLKIENFKNKMSNKIYENIQKVIETTRFYKFISATNILGRGIAEKITFKILKRYPNFAYLCIMDNDDELYDKLIEIEGIGEIMASNIISNTDSLIKLVKKLPETMKKRFLYSLDIEIKEKKSKKNVNGKTFVFSGLRNKKWEDFLISNGAKVTTSVTSKTDFLITSEDSIKNNTNSKLLKAKELGLKIYTDKEFEKEFM